MEKSTEILTQLAAEVRRRVFQIVLDAGNGHLGGCSSSVELMVALYFGGVLRYSRDNPKHPNRDRVLVRGHLGPLRYSIFSLLGWLENSELPTFYSLGTRLQGHEDMNKCPGVDITRSGSLGMLLSYGAGAAVALKNMNSDAKTYVFLGDGEEQEGNVSEAARHIVSLGLNNLVCIIDQNKKQLSTQTEFVDNGDIRKIWEGYGWEVTEIDGHSFESILNAYELSRNQTRPFLIIAHTTKGKLLKGAEEHFSGYHTKTERPENIVEEALASLGVADPKALAELLAPVNIPAPQDFVAENVTFPTVAITRSESNKEEKIASVLKHCMKDICSQYASSNARLYAMTADLVKKELLMFFGFNTPGIVWINVGLREQHLLAMAHGICTTDPKAKVIIYFGDPFFYRAADQLNVIAQSGDNVLIYGVNSGLSMARNGFTHQSVGQPGMILTMPGIQFLEPSDPMDIATAFETAVNSRGPYYIRLHGLAVQNNQKRGDSSSFYVTFEPENAPKMVLVTSGLLVPSVTAAGQELNARVVNLVNLKFYRDPMLVKMFLALLEEGLPLYTFYNGNKDVLNFVVSFAVLSEENARPSVIKSYGFDLGTTGGLEELIRHFSYDKEGIVKIVRGL